MEASTSSALTPLLHAADAWQEVALLLPVLIGLEIVLSADNAIALAAIARKQPDAAAQQRALNLGLVFALLFRVVLILAAQWVLNFRPLMGAGAVYLLWLCLSHFFLHSANDDDAATEESPGPAEAAAKSLAATAFTIALTDLAFSLDSVAAAVAVSDRIALVITGGVVGVVALRLSSGLFIRLLQRYRRLEAAGYLAVGLVGIQLSVRVFRPDVELPEWALLLLVAVLFLWGFSAQQPDTGEVQP
ncbi:TerC family protein [Synechococcus sp. MIT S9452]|uniref:TerC family protein n=1 Tax=Synechococcus sp. MIT S9452 TaxID=3082546 RepID=UPI0039A605D6